MKIYGAIQLGLKATNNVAEYGALIARLKMELTIKVMHIKVHSDPQLIMNLV